MKALRWAFAAALAFLGACVAQYAAGLVALARRGRPLGPPPIPRGSEPLIRVVVACRDGAVCLPGLKATFDAQDYPRDRFHVTIVADNCVDDTAAVARALGFDVYERHDRATAGKGNAITDYAQNVLRHDAFDVMAVLDVDGRVQPTFLRRLAAHARALRAHGAPLLVACATYAKNPVGTPLAETGDVIQALLRLHQEGRAARGRDAVLYGSHGYALTREALERIDWTTCTGLVGEDMECRLRSVLAGTPVRYAPDLRVYNDVTVDRPSSLAQRRRWNAIYPALIRAYLPRLLRAGQIDAAFGVLLLPGLGNLFLYLVGTTAAAAALARVAPAFRRTAAVGAALTAADVLYLVAALRRAGVRLTARELRKYAAYVGIKAVALAQGPFHMHVKDWAAAPHEADR